MNKLLKFIFIFIFVIITGTNYFINAGDKDLNENIIINEVKNKDKSRYFLKYDNDGKLIYISAKKDMDTVLIETLDLKGASHSFYYDKNNILVKITTDPPCACPDFYVTNLKYDKNNRLSIAIINYYFGEEAEEQLLNKKIITFIYNDKNELINKEIKNINYQKNNSLYSSLMLIIL